MKSRKQSRAVLTLAASIIACAGTSVVADDSKAESFPPILSLSNPAMPQEEGELELSAVTSYFGGCERDAAFDEVISYDVNNRLTLEIELSYAIQDPASANEESSFGNIGLNAFYCFYHAPTTLLSTSLELHIPTGSGTGELGSETTEVEIALLAARRVGDLEIDGSIGGAFTRGDESHTVDLGMPIALTEDYEPLGLMLEVTDVFCIPQMDDRVAIEVAYIPS